MKQLTREQFQVLRAIMDELDEYLMANGIKENPKHPLTRVFIKLINFSRTL